MTIIVSVFILIILPPPPSPPRPPPSSSSPADHYITTTTTGTASGIPATYRVLTLYGTHCYKCFVSLNPYNKDLRQIQLLSPFYRQGNQDMQE